MRPDIRGKGAGGYVCGDAGPFDQKDQMIIRSTWDPPWLPIARQYFGYHDHQDRPGWTLREESLNDAGWWPELTFNGGQFTGNMGLNAWEAAPNSSHRVRKGMKLENAGPAELTRMVKRAARLYGASLVGVARLDRRWIYSHTYHTITKEHKPLVIPGEFQHVVVLAHEMDYNGIRQAPNMIAAAAVSTVYSRMALVAGVMAQFIRGLGFKAIPAGNDTSPSIPLAIDAGIGEVGRAGWLITPEFGPRQRLNKIFTDMPLVPDNPRDSGAWDFCLRCQKCARNCPSQAIQYGPPSDKTFCISNRPGIFRWAMNVEKCYTWMATRQTDCATCMRVCPLNKPRAVVHRVMKWRVNHMRFLDPLLARADDFFGYGKQAKPEDFWKG